MFDTVAVSSYGRFRTMGLLVLEIQFARATRIDRVESIIVCCHGLSRAPDRERESIEFRVEGDHRIGSWFHPDPLVSRRVLKQDSAASYGNNSDCRKTDRLADGVARGPFSVLAGAAGLLRSIYSQMHPVDLCYVIK